MPSGIEIELRLAWVVEGAERSQCKPSEAEITPEQRDLKINKVDSSFAYLFFK